MSLITFPRYLLTPEEIAEAGARFRATLEPYAEKDSILERLLKRIGETVDIVVDVLGEARGNSLTQSVLEKDEFRDTLFVNLVKFLRGLKFHFSPEKAQAASLLYGIVKNHGFRLHMSSYAVQSIKLKALFSDLESDEAKQAIGKLEIATAVEDLVRAEEDFTAAHRELVSSKADDNLPPVGEIAGPLSKQLLQILNHVDIMETLEPEAWARPVDELNVVISEFATRARARKTRGEENGDDDAAQLDEVLDEQEELQNA